MTYNLTITKKYYGSMYFPPSTIRGSFLTQSTLIVIVPLNKISKLKNRFFIFFSYDFPYLISFKKIKGEKIFILF